MYNSGGRALKYDCSYQQVRNWVIRYEKMGQAGLEDRRGRRISSLPSRTPEEHTGGREAHPLQHGRYRGARGNRGGCNRLNARGEDVRP
ncbi:helix-turn-helix domain-containing protein [Coprococcus comes]|uniref:helix-turn-helix domain-containing protein n=1 Tax=Coprococcus comes TaxID=410072 RepID=UPI002FE6D8B9